MVVDRGGWDMAWPQCDERHTYATLVNRTLEAFELAVAAEERGVGTAFLVRAVVAGEDYQCVVGQTFLVEFAQDVAHVCVETGNHPGELCMGVF